MGSKGCRDLHSGSVGNQKRHHDDKQRSNATSPFEWWSCCCSLDSPASLHLHSSFSAQTLWYRNHANQASCFLGWWEIWPMFSSPYCPLTYHPQPLLFRRLWCVRFIIDLFTFISLTNGVISSTFPPSPYHHPNLHKCYLLRPLIFFCVDDTWLTIILTSLTERLLPHHVIY